MRNKPLLNAENQTFFYEQETVEGLQHQAVTGASFLKVSIEICQKLASKFGNENTRGPIYLGNICQQILCKRKSQYACDA